MMGRKTLVEENFRNLIFSKQVENERDYYQWTSEYKYVKFWEFLSINCLQMESFFILLDVESGPYSGWEKFAEIMGLTLWEDRKWCLKYHGGVGPTKAVLSKLVEKETFDKDLSLSTVLEYLKEMDRYDILLNVEWKSLVDRFKLHQKPEKEKILCKSLLFQLKLKAGGAQIGSAENAKDASLDLLVSKPKKEKRNKELTPKPVILISYAQDAEPFATKVAKLLRNDGMRESSDKKILVIMIGEQDVKQKLAVDPFNVLHKWINQVWFVVPVLSPQYLRQVQNQYHLADNSDMAKFNKLIYSFMSHKYFSDGARNFQCRPICSKEYFPQVQMSTLVKGNGLLSGLWCLDNHEEIEEFGKLLMDKPLQ